MLSEKKGDDCNNGASEKQECGTWCWTRRAEEAVMKQAREESAELRDNGAAKAQGKDKCGWPDGGCARSCNSKLLQEQDNRGTEVVHAYFQTYSPKECGGSAGWKLPPQPHSPAGGLAWHERPAHQEKPCPPSIKSKSAITSLSWDPWAQTESHQTQRKSCGDPWISLQNYSTEANFTLPGRQRSVPRRETKKLSPSAAHSMDRHQSWKYNHRNAAPRPSVLTPPCHARPLVHAPRCGGKHR